jgi:hypothetical protein
MYRIRTNFLKNFVKFFGGVEVAAILCFYKIFLFLFFLFLIGQSHELCTLQLKAVWAVAKVHWSGNLPGTVRTGLVSNLTHTKNLFVNGLNSVKVKQICLV